MQPEQMQALMHQSEDFAILKSGLAIVPVLKHDLSNDLFKQTMVPQQY